MKQKSSRIPYIKAIPEILKYQLVTKLILAMMIVCSRFIGTKLLASTGRVAVSSGDFGFLFVTWQGWLMLLLFLTVFFFYVAIDLNVKIIYSDNIIRGVKEPMRKVFTDGILSVFNLFSVSGFGVILYITLIAPIVGVGFSIGLTEGLKIPNFITSVIHDTPLYNVLYTVTVIVLAAVGFVYIFTLHGILLNNLKVRKAEAQSFSIIRHNLFSFLWQNITFTLFVAIPIIIAAVLFILLPLAVISLLTLPEFLSRFLMLFVMLFGLCVSGAASLLASPFLTLKITQLYYKYTAPEKINPQPPEKGKSIPKLVYVLVPILCIAIAFGGASAFDEIFPAAVTTQIVAHRGGGNEGPENTVAGINKAVELGASGSEIDIQRTKDGAYIVNHDNGFSRVAGVDADVGSLTLEEVKKLTVLDTGEPIATFEEMLEASRGRITLFIELKGVSADIQMCDDAVEIVRSMGMENEVVFISLKYNLIDYLESTYPEMQTGYLTFLSYGNTEKLNCDYIGLEEESATSTAIESVHAQGKKLLVWTVNTLDSQEHFLASKADGIITDNVVQANDVIDKLNNRSDLERVLSIIRQF